jgi:hypothetical protein
VRALARVLFGMVLLTSFVWAQGSDPHTDSDPAHSLYRRSSFVHGYIHGYEDGFHTGDLEVHMGHPSQPVEHYKLYQKSPGYHSRFGDRSSFHRGYQQGFRAAYDDAINGEVFRAVSEIRRAAQGLEAEATADRQFDQALSAGYEAGRNQALQQPRSSLDYQYSADPCLSQRGNHFYCDAYARGFTLGYSDGAVFQHAQETQTARK